MLKRHQVGIAVALAVIAVPVARAQESRTEVRVTRVPNGEMRNHPGDMMEEHDAAGQHRVMVRMNADGPGSIGSMLLSHTAELKLTDAQVTRLAAIARRTDERHKAARATMDSVMKSHMAMSRTDRDKMPMQDDAGMRAMHERMMAAERADVRDALAVLTVDQQADAWMMRSPGMRMHGPM